MLGIQKDAVVFQIFKPVMGVDSNRYRDGFLETKKKSEIAMLSRLADDHALEVKDTVPFEPEIPEAPEVLEDLSWMEIVKHVEALGVYKVGMTKNDCLMILRAHRAAPEGFSE